MDDASTARIAALEEQVAQLASRLATAALPPVPPAVDDVAGDVSDRRTLLRRAGAVALTAVGAAVVTSKPAAAADGSPLTLGLVGGTNTNASRTGITYTGAVSGAAYLFQQGTTYTPDSSASPVALAGWASAVDAAGIYGYANNGVGIFAVGYGSGANQGYGLVATGGRASIRVAPAGTSPPARSDAHQVGELLADVIGGLWYCVTAGSPGTWRRLASAATAGSLHVLAAPIRAYDSRPTQGASTPKGKLAPGVDRTIDLTFNAAVPTAATAALLNITVTETVSAGFLAAFSNAVAYPGTSTLNWSSASANLSNSAVVAVDSLARIKIRANSATHAIIDVAGYYL